MSNDSFTVVTRQSWLNRIGDSLKGIVIGGLLTAVAFPLLFWNEGRAVTRDKTLKEGGSAVVSVAADDVRAENEGRLVHLTGLAETAAVLSDPDFGVSAPALKLDRVVEMYQWDENEHRKTKEKLGGGTETTTTYTYSKTWSERPIRSSGFKQPDGHQNPSDMPCASLRKTADAVTLGAFALPPSLVAQINLSEPLPVAADGQPATGRFPRLKAYGGGFYIGADPAAPEVGDLRVTFKVTRPAVVSLIAKQTGRTLAPYTTRAGGDLELLQVGTHTPDAMIRQAQDDNRTLTWLLRAAGFLVMLIGLNLLLKPLSVLASVVPLLGRLVGAGTGLVAFLMATGLSLVTIATAWLRYRPLVGVALLAGAVVAVAALRRRLKSGPAAR